MDDKGFNESLAYGEEVELEVVKKLQKTHPSTVKIPGKFSQYDIFVPETDTKIEVKTDRKSIYTGNYVVEIEMYDKPSGLLTTKADWWIFTDKVDMIWITPTKLIQTIILNNLQWVTFYGKGDTQSKKAYLIKKELLYKSSNKIQPY